MDGVKTLIGKTDFFRYLLAGLALKGLTVIDVRNDRQHAALTAALEGKDRVSEFFPILIPSPLVGRYRDFDRALVTLQSWGLTSAHAPHFVSVEILITPGYAQRILGELQQDRREELLEFAGKFIRCYQAG